MKNWLKYAKPCPLCRSKDKMNKTPSLNFQYVKERCGGGVVRIECTRCDIEVKDFGQRLKEEEIPDNYNNVLMECMNKWNRLWKEEE